MSLSRPGESTSQVEVTNISSHGVWIFAHGEELFMPYDEFPWFKDVPVAAILRVEEPVRGHFYWPELDVDLGIETLRHPERFPLRSGA
jgi:hypothetical protein